MTATVVGIGPTPSNENDSGDSYEYSRNPCRSSRIA